MSFLLSIHMLNSYGLPVFVAKLHFRFHKLSAFDMPYYWISYAKYLSGIQKKIVLSLTHIISGILPKYESVAFWQLTRANNTIWNRPLYEMSNSFCEKAHPSSIYTLFNTRYVLPLFSYADTLFEWSQMKIIKLEFPIFWHETIFYV